MFGEADDPLVELRICMTDEIRRGSPIELDAAQRTSVSALLAQAPALVQSGHIALTQTYRLTFAPDVAGKMTRVMDAQGGGLHAAALDRQGKIIGQGVLHPTNGVRALAATAAVWQTLAVITAQVHLSEINQRLAPIERGINEIRAWLEADQMSKVESGLRYVREAGAALVRHDLSEQERVRLADQLEHIWRDCGQVSRATLLMLNRAPGEFATLELNAWYRLDESAALAREAIVAYERHTYAYLLAAFVRCATIVLRGLQQLNPGVSEHRLDELRSDLTDWRDSVRTFFLAVNERVRRDLSATFSSQATVNDEQRKLLDQANEAAQRLIAFCVDVERLSLHARAQTQNRPATAKLLTLFITLDQHGQVVATHHISDFAKEPMLNPTRGQA